MSLHAFLKSDYAYNLSPVGRLPSVYIPMHVSDTFIIFLPHLTFPHLSSSIPDEGSIGRSLEAICWSYTFPSVDCTGCTSRYNCIDPLWSLSMVCRNPSYQVGRDL